MRLHLHDGVSLRLDPASVDFIIRTNIPVQQMQWQKKHAPWLDVRY